MDISDELEYLIFYQNYELLMGTAFICCCVGVLVLLLQCFIPCVRRFYRKAAEATLTLCRVRPENIPLLSSLLDTYMAWLHFAWGICLFPLCFGLYADAFHPSMSGPLNFGFAPLMLFFSCVLMLLVFFIGTLWAFLSWLLRQHQQKA